jgi:hypothetical protein
MSMSNDCALEYIRIEAAWNREQAKRADDLAKYFDGLGGKVWEAYYHMGRAECYKEAAERLERLLR